MNACAEVGCMAIAKQSSRFCACCFDRKWGVETINTAALPACLLDIVVSYWELCPEQCTTVEYLRFVLPFCSLAKAIDFFEYQLHLDTSFQLLSLIADRFCHAPDFWSLLELNCGTDPYYLILTKSLDVAQVLAQLYPIHVDIGLLRIALSQQTDDVMLWLLTKTTNLNLLSNCEVTEAQNVTKWQSKLVLNQLINIGYFADQSNVNAMLRSMADYSTSIDYFTIVWNLQYETTCYQKNKHESLFSTALRLGNAPMLDVFANLLDFKVTSIADVIQYTNIFDTLVTWLIRHKLVTHEWLWQNDMVKFSCANVLTLLHGGSLAFLSQEERTALLLDRCALQYLIKEKRKSDFYATLNTMSHLGSKHQFRELFTTLYVHWSLIDFLQLAEHPLFKPRLTFAVMREARPDFLAWMFFNDPSILHLQLFESWQDCDGSQMQLCDVIADNSRLSRMASNRSNNELKLWITSFYDTNQHLTPNPKRRKRKKQQA